MERIVGYQHERAVNVLFCKNFVNLYSKKYEGRKTIRDLRNKDFRSDRAIVSSLLTNIQKVKT
jgi:hypothetical protein